MGDSDSGVKKPVTANEYVEQQLHIGLSAIESAFSCHALSFSGPLLNGVDDILRSTIEKKCGAQASPRKLAILLTTPGGYLEPVQRMVATLRKHYRVIDFVIPNYAYSAGTLFALSGDAIHMDYYSRLGPIDPPTQVYEGAHGVRIGPSREIQRADHKSSRWLYFGGGGPAFD